MKTKYAESYAASQATPKPSGLKQQPLFRSRFCELAIRPGLSRRLFGLGQNPTCVCGQLCAGFAGLHGAFSRVCGLRGDNWADGAGPGGLPARLFLMVEAGILRESNALDLKPGLGDW